MIETWRIAYRMMQELGIKFEKLCVDGEWRRCENLSFTSEQDRYRIDPDQIAPGNWCDIYRAAQALGVKFDYKTMENERWVEVGHSEPFMVLCFHRYRLHIEELKEAEPPAEKEVDVTSGRTEMTFEPQCTEQWQLFAEYSRVLKMCKDAGFDRPWECVKQCRIVFEELPEFNTDPTTYKFALAIVEKKPVFRGDVLYDAEGRGHAADQWCADKHPIAFRHIDGCAIGFERLSWNPPKRTIEINGVKVKAPNKSIIHRGSGVMFVSQHFDSEADAEAFKAALEGKK